jgi:hypothetical protein
LTLDIQGKDPAKLILTAMSEMMSASFVSDLYANEEGCQAVYYLIIATDP